MSRSYDIFLSHSGAQKDFVEHLNAELARVCGHCSVFFDRDSIEHGEQISTSILEYAGTCKLAVAVLSEEYFTRSRPPMMELAASYTAAKAGNGFPPLPCLLPVFLALRPEDAKDSSTQSGWRKVWQKWEVNEKMSERRKSRPSRVQPTVWKEAVDRLLDTRGPIYIPHENAYDPEVFLKKVAQVIARKLDVLNGGIDPSKTWVEKPGIAVGDSRSGEGSLDQIERVAQASTAASVGDSALHGHVTVFNWESTLFEDMNRRRAGSLSTGSSTSSSQDPYSLDRDRNLALAPSDARERLVKQMSLADLRAAQEASSSQYSYTLDRDRNLALAPSDARERLVKQMSLADLRAAQEASSSQYSYTLDRDRNLALAPSDARERLVKQGTGADLTAIQEASSSQYSYTLDRDRNLALAPSDARERLVKQGTCADLTAIQEASSSQYSYTLDRDRNLALAPSDARERFVKQGTRADLTAIQEASSSQYSYTLDRDRNLALAPSDARERLVKQGTCADLTAIQEAFYPRFRSKPFLQ